MCNAHLVLNIYPRHDDFSSSKHYARKNTHTHTQTRTHAHTHARPPLRPPLCRDFKPFFLQQRAEEDIKVSNRSTLHATRLKVWYSGRKRAKKQTDSLEALRPPACQTRQIVNKPSSRILKSREDRPVRRFQVVLNIT